MYKELSRNAMEDAYAEITSEARNQYTLGYPTKGTASSAYRSIEVVVGNHETFAFNEQVFGALVQYPDTFGAIHDFSGFAEKIGLPCSSRARRNSSAGSVRVTHGGLAEIVVRTGEMVASGQSVGLAGDTTYVGVRRGEWYVDPRRCGVRRTRLVAEGDRDPHR